VQSGWSTSENSYTTVCPYCQGFGRDWRAQAETAQDQGKEITPELAATWAKEFQARRKFQKRLVARMSIVADGDLANAGRPPRPEGRKHKHHRRLTGSVHSQESASTADAPQASPEEVRRGLWVGDSGPSTALVVEMLSPWVVLKQLKKYLKNAEAGEGSAVESPTMHAHRRLSTRLASTRSAASAMAAVSRRADEAAEEEEEKALVLLRAVLALRRHSAPVFWNCLVMFRLHGLPSSHLLLCASAPSPEADEWLDPAPVQGTAVPPIVRRLQLPPVPETSPLGKGAGAGAFSHGVHPTTPTG